MLQGSFLGGSQRESCLKSKWLSTLYRLHWGDLQQNRRVELLDPHLASESQSQGIMKYLMLKAPLHLWRATFLFAHDKEEPHHELQ